MAKVLHLRPQRIIQSLPNNLVTCFSDSDPEPSFACLTPARSHVYPFMYLNLHLETTRGDGVQ